MTLIWVATQGIADMKTTHFEISNGSAEWVEDYLTRIYNIGNQTPCIYLAIEEQYQREGKGTTPLVKIGLTRSMGRRRGALYQTYGVRTVREVPSSDRCLEKVEAALIQWLHNVPTSRWRSDETAYIDAAIVDLMVEDFTTLVQTLTEYYEGV